MAFFQPVVFRLDNEKYGINISYVSGIEYEQTIVRVPNSSRNIKGIIAIVTAARIIRLVIPNYIFNHRICVTFIPVCHLLNMKVLGKLRENVF